jgi:hypothetical protein
MPIEVQQNVRNAQTMAKDSEVRLISAIVNARMNTTPQETSVCLKLMSLENNSMNIKSEKLFSKTSRSKVEKKPETSTRTHIRWITTSHKQWLGAKCIRILTTVKY